MMKTLMKWGIALLLIGLSPALADAQYDYVDIRNPSLRKIPVAVPLFKINPKAAALPVNPSDRTAGYLDFTGFFKILDRGMFLMDPADPVTDETSINFKNWTTIGAELMITGNVTVTDDLIEMELRLFDPFKGQLVVGKRYKGWVKDTDRIVRRFCSEVIHHLTGNWGVFNSEIAFISTGTGHKEIFVCDFDGGQPRQMTRLDSITLTPAWSSDGKWLAFTSYAKKHPDLYIKNMAENRGTVFSKKGINTTPAWFPGEFILAATLSFTGDQDIYLLSGDGKIIRQLTKQWGIDTSPTWSPDGKQMAFVSSRSGSPQIYVKNMATGHEQRLTFEGKYNTQPSWSPRGDRIAYSSIEGGEINIHVFDLEQRVPIRLTYGSGKNESPTWSPDGSLIAFSSSRDGASRIYVMTGYGTDQRKLLTLPGEQFSPAWSPNISFDQ